MLCRWQAIVIPTLAANIANSMTDGRTNGLSLAHIYHEKKSCSNFGSISSSG